MKDIDLSSMINRAKVVYDVIESEYKVFLSSSSKEMLENVLFSNLFKMTENLELPPIYLSGDTYYLNRNLDKDIKTLNGNDLYSTYLRKIDLNTIYNDLVVFFVLSSFCGELNPLKLGLIEFESRNICDKYKISNSNINNYKEYEIACLVKEKILGDVPFNIIFLDSDIEIFHYLTIEKGIEVAKLYHQISEMMKNKYKNIKNKKFSLKRYLEFYDSLNYDDVFDLIYDFINLKIK